jgi:CubicO group peptidase (beta-lactamase class C family)
MSITVNKISFTRVAAAFVMSIFTLACTPDKSKPQPNSTPDASAIADAGTSASADASAPSPDSGTNAMADAGTSQPDASTADTGVEECQLSADLDDFINTLMTQNQIPGLSAGIVTGSGLVWSKGYGFADIAAARAPTADTIFAMMSISKVVTSAGVMQLVESSQLDLDADINDYLDDFDIIHPQFPNTPITTRQLLSHTSGLAADDYGILQLNIHTNDADVQPLGQMLKNLLVPGESRYDDGFNWSDNAPGTIWTYSSIGMSLAGLVAESIANRGFDQLTDANIFQRLGMPNTSWRLTPYQNRLDDLAVMYHWSEPDQRHDIVEHFTFADYPAGSIRSSVSDFSRFLAAMINDGIHDGQRILQASTAQAMRDIQFEALNGGQGIGWQYRYDDRTLIGHGGDDSGASTDMWYDVDTGKGVIMLMNVTRREETDQILLRLIEETDNCN